MPILVEEDMNRTSIPEMYRVRQKFARKSIDPSKEVWEELNKPEIKALVQKGEFVAVAVGSRGISGIGQIVRQVVSFLKELGASPFIVPAMGSHGGGIAENQTEILDGYGINEANVGAPIMSSMETVEIGKTEAGIPVYMDRLAADADKIIVINRVKVHTTFSGDIESGLCKMLAIGLGKHKGCAELHRHGTEDFGKIIPSVAHKMIEKANVAFGIAIVEDAFENIGMIRAVKATDFLKKEPELLEISRNWMAKLYFDYIDILIVEHIGKDVSGAGMDPNIVGRRHFSRTEAFNPVPIKRIIVLGLTEATHGNACGIGRADFTLKRVFDKINLEFTYANCLAAGVPESGRIPMMLENEQEAILAAMQSCDSIPSKDIRIVKIKDTLHLEEIQVSENTLEYCRNNENFEIVEDVSSGINICANGGR